MTPPEKPKKKIGYTIKEETKIIPKGAIKPFNNFGREGLVDVWTLYDNSREVPVMLEKGNLE